MMLSNVKTLAQLEEEGKEKRYVTLEMGSKISGYTRDYLERLCRLNKVEYRIWNNGQFVIELESLLKETHAMLLSFEGVTFVEHSELTDPVPQFVANILSPVIAKAQGNVSGKPVAPRSEGTPDPTPTFSGVNNAAGTAGPASVETPLTGFSYFGKSVNSKNTFDKAVADGAAQAGALPTSHSADPTAKIRPHDEWDHSILAAHSDIAAKEEAPVAKPSPADVPSQYRPIVTEIDVSAHRDESPLFPELKKDGFVVSLTDQRVKNTSSMSGTDTQGREQHAGHSFHVAIDRGGTNADASRYREEVSVTPPLVVASTVAPAEEKPVVPETPIVATSSAAPEVTKEPKETIVNTTAATAPLSRPKENTEPLAPLPRYVPTPVFPVSMPVPHAPSRAVRTSGSLPTLRVMPEVAAPQPALPMRSEEHHLSVYDPHPLTKSPTFNLVIAVLLLGSLAFAVNNYYPGSPEIYVAGVGASDAPGVPGGVTKAAADTTEYDLVYPSVEEAANDPSVLPFSDDVVVAVGDKPETILVQPVFRDKTGIVSQYRIDVEHGLVED